MKISVNEWKLMTMAFNNELNDALQQQHHAAQFIALVGRHLIPQQPDDSNTNMEFIFDKDMLLGNALANGMRVTLQLSEIKISILDKDNNVKNVIALEGKTKQKVFDELTQNLADFGIDVTDFKNELHYEIPSHQLDKGAVFSIKNKNDFIENTNYRHNAKIILNEIAQQFEQEEPIRIWPHHFDTGAFFTIGKNEKGETTETIGIGLAIPDSMIDEPYYYLSFWSENPIKGIEKLDTLDAGRWMMPDWNGAVLKQSEILKVDSETGQHKLVKSFFTSGMNILVHKLNQ